MGMLFDHGCDAMTAFHFNIVIQRMIQTGNGTFSLVLLFVSILPFYLITLDEFYSGILVMPAFSGPDDASLAILFASLVTAYYGSE